MNVLNKHSQGITQTSLATYIVNSKPKIKAIFDAWKSSSPDAFLSNLEKNQELKAVVLEENALGIAIEK